MRELALASTLKKGILTSVVERLTDMRKGHLSKPLTLLMQFDLESARNLPRA